MANAACAGDQDQAPCFAPSDCAYWSHTTAAGNCGIAGHNWDQK